MIEVCRISFSNFYYQVGCGVGNTVFPILEVNTHPNTRVYACDFSETAVELVKQHPEYVKNEEGSNENIGKRCEAFVCDITKEQDWEANAPFGENSLGIKYFCLSNNII